MALIGAALVFAGALVAKPALTMDEGGRVAFDGLLCDVFPADACTHVARLTKDEEQQLQYLAQACLGGVDEECMATALNLHQVKPEQAARLWAKSCDGGYVGGCANLVFMYENARGVDRDEARAVSLFRQGCDGGNSVGCYNLGVMHRLGRGVEADLDRTRSFYQRACDLGDDDGCVWRDRLTKTVED